MVEPQEQAETLAVNNTAEFSALVAQMASQTEALGAVQSQLSDITAKYEEAQAQLSSIEAEKADMIVSAEAAAIAAKAKVLATRQEKLAAIMGDIEAPKVAAVLADLPNETFETILGSYAASYKAEAESPLFKEAGISAEAAPVEQDAVQKLAASLAAKFNVK